MNAEQFKQRTKSMSLRIIRLVEALPASRTADVIGKQLLRSGTAIGANYRAACRAKSPRDMISKLKIVEEETDETIYWIELLVEANLIPIARTKDLVNEAEEILAMTVASIKTLTRTQSKVAQSTTNQQSSINNRQYEND